MADNLGIEQHLYREDDNAPTKTTEKNLKFKFLNLISNIQTQSDTDSEFKSKARRDLRGNSSCKICRLPKSSKRSKLIYSRFSCPCDVDVSIAGEEYKEDHTIYGVNRVLRSRHVTFENNETYDDAVWVNQPDSLLSLLDQNMPFDSKHSSKDIKAIVSKKPPVYYPFQSHASDMRVSSDTLLEKSNKTTLCKNSSSIIKSNSFACGSSSNLNVSDFRPCKDESVQRHEEMQSIPYRRRSSCPNTVLHGVNDYINVNEEKDSRTRSLTSYVSLPSNESSNPYRQLSNKTDASLNANNNHFEDMECPDINGICVNLNDSPDIEYHKATIKQISPKLCRKLMCRPANGIGDADIELTVHTNQDGRSNNSIDFAKQAENRKNCYDCFSTFEIPSPCLEMSSLLQMQCQCENDFLVDICTHHHGQTETSLEPNINCIYPLNENLSQHPRTFHFSRPDIVAHILHGDQVKARSLYSNKRYLKDQEDRQSALERPLYNGLTDSHETHTHSEISKLHRDITSSECNNSNDAAVHPDRAAVGQQYTGRVIRAEGDGRCLFRSLVTLECPRLQVGLRDEFGRPERREDAEIETMKADELRAKVVRLMRDNLHFYSQLEKGVINADQPIPVSYQQFLDRLEAMSNCSTMPGDLELNAAAMVLEKQILVLNTDLRKITTYGQDRYPQSVPLAVRYTRLVADVGHYDAVILDPPDLKSQNDSRYEEEMEICNNHDPYSELCQLAVRGNNIPGDCGSRGHHGKKLEIKLSAKQEFFFYRDINKNKFAIERPTSRPYNNSVQPFSERSAQTHDSNKTSVSRTSSGRIKQDNSGTKPKSQDSHCSSRSRHISSTSVPRPEPLNSVNPQLVYSPSGGQRPCVGRHQVICKKYARARSVKQQDSKDKNILYPRSRSAVESLINAKATHGSNSIPSSTTSIRMSRKRKNQDMNENSKAGRKKCRHHETQKNGQRQGRVYKCARKAPGITSRSKIYRLSNTNAKSKKYKDKTAVKQKTSSAVRGQKPHLPRSTDSSTSNDNAVCLPDNKIPDIFSKNQCRCFLCKDVVKIASHTWLKCYICGRVAHRMCVLRQSPEWSLSNVIGKKKPRCVEEVRVRKATHEDFDGVMAINQSIYWGRDYLPSTYHYLLRNPHSHAVVCQHEDNTIAGFSAGHIMDDGSTLVLSSGRVKDTNQGQGLTRRMVQEIRNFFKFRGLDVKQEFIVTKGSNMASSKKSFSDEYEDTFQRDILCFEFHRQELNYCSDRKTASRLKFIRQRDIDYLLSSRNNRGKDAYELIINWTPVSVGSHVIQDFYTHAIMEKPIGKDHLENKLRQHKTKVSDISLRSNDQCYERDEPCSCNESFVTLTNFDTVERESHLSDVIKVARTQKLLTITPEKFLKSKESGDYTDRSILRDQTEEINRGSITTKTIISFGSYFPCNLGVAYNLDLYCFGDFINLSHLELHLMAHVEKASSIADDQRVHMLVFVGKEATYSRQIVDCMKRLGATQGKWSSARLHLYKRKIMREQEE